MANASGEMAKKRANPKQLLLLVALSGVLVTVGVVQFGGLFGGSGAPAPAQAQSSASARASGGTAAPTVPAPATGVQLPPLAPRDPFRPTIQVARQPAEGNKVVRSTPAPRREITGTPPIPPMTLPGGQLGLQPAENTPPPEPERPHYTVTGVVQGPHSVAILADSEGRRRLVKPGDPLEDGWRVVNIQRGVVTLRKGKQQITVRVGESTTPNGGNKP
ncbi:MAG: hypothetical protein NZ874_09805 [Fimbriimonadales bacterium]|nr:hypothetical protein [Fimbriimonadales bacterium]